MVNIIIILTSAWISLTLPRLLCRLLQRSIFCLKIYFSLCFTLSFTFYLFRFLWIMEKCMKEGLVVWGRVISWYGCYSKILRWEPDSQKRGNLSSSLNLNLTIHSSGSKYVTVIWRWKSKRKKKAKCTLENENSLQKRDIYGISPQQKHFHLNSLKSTPQLKWALACSSGMSYWIDPSGFHLPAIWYCFHHFLTKYNGNHSVHDFSHICSACLTAVVIGTPILVSRVVGHSFTKQFLLIMKTHVALTTARHGSMPLIDIKSFNFDDNLRR